MKKVFIIDKNGTTKSMEQKYCKDEEKELQDLLENNYDLLADDQINPDNPRRWLLVKREMPVIDPSTGQNRWYIDFFFVDQSGMPTFVECKLYKNTQARREVVGQMKEFSFMASMGNMPSKT